MPVTPTYPGVYIEEIPSGVRTIVGVATSITAFLGRTPRGPTNTATTITGFGDFERTFGGLAVDMPLTYAVRDFFLNGGGQAIIVRLFHAKDATAAEKATQRVAHVAITADNGSSAKARANDEVQAIKSDSKSTDETKTAVDELLTQINSLANDADNTAIDKIVSPFILATSKADITIDAITLETAYEGTWGATVRAYIDRDVSKDVADRLQLTRDDLFNLTVINDAPGGITERFNNLSLKESARRADRVLAQESQLVRWKDKIDQTATLPSVEAGKILDDQLTKLKQDLETKRKEQQAREKELQVAEQGQDQQAIQNAKNAVDTAKDNFNKAQTEVNKVFVTLSDGNKLTRDDFLPDDGRNAKHGIYALEEADLFNILCIPPDPRNGDVDPAVLSEALQYCVERRAMLLVDAPKEWATNDGRLYSNLINNPSKKLNDLGISGPNARNAAIYFPRVKQSDPLRDGQIDTFAPCGIIAGIMARTDTQRGVWKAPAGLDAALNGVQGLEVMLTDRENGVLNPVGINCLRSFPVTGRVVWGARTMRGADLIADEYKYIPVRRLALFIEESLYRGTQWVVFEPNDEPLWAQIRLNVGAFMHDLFRKGAFQGTTPKDAYFVCCNRDTTTQNNINLGIVNIVVGFAPLKPAEFVIIKLQQMAGQIDV